MDFDPRDFDSRDDDRLAARDAHDDRHRDDEARSLGRGPGTSRESDNDERGCDPRDYARWPDRERDPREQTITPREPFTRHLDLPRGPERELVHDRDRDYTLRGSETRTLARVGAFRVVSSRNLRDNHDRPLDPRSSDLRHLREQGLVETVRVAGSREYAVGLTREGQSLLERHRGPDRDQDGGQTFWSGVKRERELEHDIQVYRAYEREAARLEAQGARVDRVVLDHELKREYQQWLHAHDGERADYDGHPDREPYEIEDWAREHELPYFDEQVHFPDVRIEYENADGRWEQPRRRGGDGALSRRAWRGSGPIRLQVLRRIERARRQPCTARRARRGDARVTPDERVKAVEAFGFTARQARFLVTVMLYSGVCVPRQYAAFARIAYGHKVSRFFDGLADGEFALMSDCLHNRAHLYHLTDARLYRAIGQPHSRYRRPVSARQAIERVMALDAVVACPDLHYLSTEDEKVAFFAGAAPSLSAARLPHLTIGSGPSQRVRLFPDDQPIGVEPTGRVVFAYLVSSGGVEEFRAFVQRHVDLLHALPEWTVRLLVPKRIAGCIEYFETAAKYECTNWFRPQLLPAIKRYFETRRATPNPRALTFEDDEFWSHTAAFGSPQFRQLYRRWLTDGDGVFESLSSPALNEALARGAGQIESRVLLCSHAHLSPLVSRFRACRKGVEGGDRAAAPSQPRRRASPPRERPHLRRWRTILQQARNNQRCNNLRAAAQHVEGAAVCAAPDSGSEPDRRGTVA